MTEIQLPVCEKGLGKLIGRIDSPDLIAGVTLAPLIIHPDDRGYFLEISRLAQAVNTQVSSALSYPGTIKAFHFHRHQTDVWTAVSGMLQVSLVDLRPQSATFGLRNTLYIGALRPWQITIPPGVGHGYKVIGTEPAILVYLTNRFYDPADEGRIPYNDPGINYDWEIQHK
jgi:dTDP-4-dehydrorhamnose 3,5-epimerase